MLGRTKIKIFVELLVNQQRLAAGQLSLKEITVCPSFKVFRLQNLARSVAV